jgi:hypothetical protein
VYAEREASASWSLASWLARVAILPHVIFEVLRSIPNLVSSEERLPPRGFCPRALALVTTLAGVIVEVLRSKQKLVPSEVTEDMETGTDTAVPKKRKREDK